MKTFARCAALAASLLLAGCCGPDHQRIAADRATYAWFATMMVAYLAADAKLDAALERHCLLMMDRTPTEMGWRVLGYLGVQPASRAA